MLKYEVSWKSVHWEPSCSMRTDRQANTTKLIVAFRSFVNALKKWTQLSVCNKCSLFLNRSRRVRKIEKSDYELHRVRPSVCVCVVCVWCVCGWCVCVCVSVCVCPRMKQLGSRWTNFYEIAIWVFFRISVQENSNVLKMWCVLSTRTYLRIISRWIVPRMRNGSDKRCRENRNTFLCSVNFPPRKSCRLWDNMEKYCTARQDTDDNVAHAQCMLDT